jgi:phosphopantetheinyl transferase
MRAFLATMDEFLGVQEQVMRGYLGRRAARPAAGAPPAKGNDNGADGAPSRTSATAAPRGPFRNGVTGGSDLPLTGTVVSLADGEELVAIREVTPAEDCFLEDHTLGGVISAFDPDLLALPVMPLTMSMEMMAEAAAVLRPGRVVTGMREVRAHRWIALDHPPLALRIQARRVAADQVRVEIREAAPSGEATPGPPMVEGAVVFGERYPAPCPGAPFSLRDERPSRWRPDELYSRGMFHGPRLQGVVSVDRWGSDGAEATLGALPADRLFRSRPRPRFFIDPVVLDAAGQLVGYWTAEHLARGFNVFPYRVAALDLYGPPLRAPERARCRARIASLGEEQLRSDIEVIGPDGRLLMRLVGWEDRRFDLPAGLYDLRISPSTGRVASDWSAPLAAVPGGARMHCCRVTGYSDDFLASSAMIWRRVLASLVLGRAERAAWDALDRPQSARNQWLLGRIAAKDAIRMFVKTRHGLDLYAADVEITADVHGRPRAGGPWVSQIGQAPVISLAHVGGLAVAVAADPVDVPAIGIDVERLGRVRADFPELVFVEEERALLGADSERLARALRAWCAKEAVAKALGRGLLGDPQALVLRAIDREGAQVRVALAGALLRQFPEWGGRTIVAHTVREGDEIVAVSCCQPGEA